jgi:quercetin dioxygenase-like cupin family protein
MKIGDVTCPDCNAGFRPARAFISDGKRILEMVATGEKVCLNVLPMPPGAKAKVHYHKGIETIAYLLEGECSVYYGDELEYRVVVQAGDQIYMPEDVPHAHTIRVPRRVNGLSCTHPVAIRMASFYCQSWT